MRRATFILIIYIILPSVVIGALMGGFLTAGVNTMRPIEYTAVEVCEGENCIENVYTRAEYEEVHLDWRRCDEHVSQTESRLDMVQNFLEDRTNALNKVTRQLFLLENPDTYVVRTFQGNMRFVEDMPESCALCNVGKLYGYPDSDNDYEYICDEHGDWRPHSEEEADWCIPCDTLTICDDEFLTPEEECELPWKQCKEENLTVGNLTGLTPASFEVTYPDGTVMNLTANLATIDLLMNATLKGNMTFIQTEPINSSILSLDPDGKCVKTEENEAGNIGVNFSCDSHRCDMFVTTDDQGQMWVCPMEVLR